MNRILTYIARTIEGYSSGFYPRLKKVLQRSGLILLILIASVPTFLQNGELNIIIIKSVGIFIAITILLFWIREKYYKPFVIINKKFVTPNTVKDSLSDYTRLQTEFYEEQRISSYNSCVNCTRTKHCTIRSNYVVQCDQYYDSFQEEMDKNSYQALDTTQEPGNLENLQFDNPNFTDPRDGNEYKTIRIGNQLWLAENLRYIPYVNKQSENGGIWVNGYSGNDVKVASMTEQFKKFGCLYSIENAFSVCPQGFHLPSNDEWLTLFYYFGGSNLAGNRLKACTGWKTITPQITDDSGFSALPGGCRTFYESFIAFGTVGYWWTSSAAQINKHFFMCIQDNRSTAIILQNKFPNSGFSIRCIKD